MDASQYFQGAVGSIFDLVFGIGGDGRRHSSAEQYPEDDMELNPNIHIHAADGVKMDAGQVVIEQKPAASESEAAPGVEASAAPTVEPAPTPTMTAAERQAVSLERQHQMSQAINTLAQQDEVQRFADTPEGQAAAFNRAWEQEQDHGIRM